MQDPEYLTTGEACAYLRLKERTIYELVARGAIPCSRITGKLLFPRRLIDRWVESRLEMQDRNVVTPPPIMAGSSDPLLDWALRESGSGLATLFEGSGAGLKRFAAGETLATGLHLRGADGSYNVEAVRSLGRITDAVLIQWAWREQGLVTRRGNPLGLAGIADLAAKKPRIAMRQPGAGADVLLDVLLEQAGLSRADLDTAPRIALTEADIATAIADGSADCGLAIGAAARRFGLDFVPLTRERFDILCSRRTYFEPQLQRLFAFTRTEAFTQRAEALGSYDIRDCGAVAFNA
jgi:putative molybdopterin biosynthesis protein